MAQMADMDPRQRAEYIEQLKAMAASGQLNLNDYDSDDEAAFYDNNDLANRIWDDNENDFWPQPHVWNLLTITSIHFIILTKA